MPFEPEPPLSGYYEAGVPQPPPQPEPHLARVVWTLLGGILGAAFVLFVQGTGLKLTGGKMTFEVFAGILLTAVAVIVAVFGAGLALLAFWGFRQLRRDAITSAVNTARQEVDRLIREEIASPVMEQRIRDRVDQIVIGNPRDQELDVDHGDEGGERA